VRILYLADIRFPLDRANGIQTMETCYALADRGHEVRLLVRPDTATPRRDPFMFYCLPPHDRLTIQRTPVVGPPPARRVAYLVRAVAAAATTRADVILTRDLGVASLVLRLPSVLRPPVVYESHGFAPVFAETMRELVSDAPVASTRKLRRLAVRERRVWRLARGYVAITAGLAADLTSRLGARRALTVVPDGVRLTPGRQFRPSRAARSPVIVYAGHLYPWKGVDVLLRALALLPDVQGIVIGGHPAERDLKRIKDLAASLKITDRVRFTGQVSRADVPPWLEQGDVLVMPHSATTVSERYASPLKLFEYMAAGKPIVASDVSSIREVLRDGENACLVPPADPAALAAGIMRVVSDPALAERIARRAFEEAADYTWARRAERLETVLRQAVAAP
jgi:glycosyltransferase involved in cell wall biosynthesis